MNRLVKRVLIAVLAAAVMTGVFFLSRSIILNGLKKDGIEADTAVPAATVERKTAAVVTQSPQTAPPVKTTAPPAVSPPVTTVPATTAPPATTVPAETTPPAPQTESATSVTVITRTERYTGAEEYAHLVGYDFRTIRRQYSEAVAQNGYAIKFTSDFGGEQCDYVLTYVQYRIINLYHQTTLHNITTGEEIPDPAAYYEMMGDRYWGGRKLSYMNQAQWILSLEEKALEGILSVMETGENTGIGVYVDANELNL